MDSSPAFLGKGLWGAPGLIFSFTVLAAALPNTTISNKELAPNLLAPCTEAQAASLFIFFKNVIIYYQNCLILIFFNYPAANNPGTTTSFPSLSMFNT